MSTISLQTEWASCDLCGANDWETLFVGRDRRHGVPGEFGVAKCRNCGHLQTNPRPTRNTIHIYYPETYSAHSLSCGRVDRSLRDLKLMKFAQRTGFGGRLLLPIATYRFRSLVPSWLNERKGSLLEVGCGVGWFCGLAKAMGWQPVGLDISADACWEARKMWSVATVCSDSLPLPFKSQTFHLVVLRHTLEHLFSPKQVLKEVHRVLKDGGWVALEVPNANSLGRKIFGERWNAWELPRHLHHFTPETLKRVLEQAGFQNVKVVSARHKPFLLAKRLFPQKHPFAKLGRFLLGLPTWMLLPLLKVSQEGEVLRAWAQK
ncbi:MAG: class I SAM-dependent methyltransferase [Armatimonadota bacterium]